MSKWSMVILFQLIFAGSIFCRIEEWTLTNWETVGKPSRPTDYNPDQYGKIYLNSKDSTFIWRQRSGARERKYSGTFIRQKESLYILTSSYGIKIQADVDTSGNVTCTILTGGSRIKYYGKVEK